MLHKRSQSRHPAISVKTYADETARLADTDFDEYDEGVFYRQLDNNSLWMLTASSPPAWQYLTSDPMILDNVNYIQYNTDPTLGAHVEGHTHWNKDDYALEYDTINGSAIQIGQEMVMVVRNNTANDLPNGKAVYYTGTTGSRPTVALANATSPLCRYTLGITTHVIPKNNVGLITIFGGVRDADTSALTPQGSVLYVSHTADGELQTTQPPAPYVTMVVGVVLYTHSTNGLIGVRIRPMQDLNYLNDSNVRNKTLNNYHFLKWYTSGYWDAIELPWLVNDYDPTGFDRGFDSKGLDASIGAISLDAPTRIFTIEPAGGESSFWFYVRGNKFIYTEAQTVEITDVDGVHAIYFDSNGVLQHATSLTEEILVATAFVAYIYWDATNKKAVVMADERHGYRMPGLVHLQKHKAYGSTFYKGLKVGDLVVDGDGNSNTTIQFSVASGEISDEDLTVDISALSLPSNVSILYRSGATGVWRAKEPDNFPLIYNGTAGYSGTLPPYNYFNGASWVLQEATNNDYLIMLYFATTDSNRPIIGVQSQARYTNLTQARAGMKEAINTFSQDGMAFVEYVSLWGMIIQVSTGYANTPKARFRTLDDGRSYLDFRTLRSGILIE